MFEGHRPWGNSNLIPFKNTLDEIRDTKLASKGQEFVW